MSQSNKILNSNAYNPKSFNKTQFSDILLSKEKAIYLIHRDKEEKYRYDNFDEIFSLYLQKLPKNNVYKFVSEVFNRNIVYLGTSSGSNNDIIFSRLLLDSNNSIVGIILDSSYLDIDISTGDTSNINNCIYAVYHSLIRASVLANQQVISKNLELHQYLTHYIYLIILRSLSKKIIFTDKQKQLINLVCIYLYYRHFLQHKHAQTISVIRKHYFNAFKDIDEFILALDTISQYDNVRYLPNALFDLKLYKDNPGILTLEMLSNKGIRNGYWSLTSSLDQLIALSVLSIYSTELYPTSTLVNEKIQQEIEKIIVPLISTLKYNPSTQFNK